VLPRLKAHSGKSSMSAIYLTVSEVSEYLKLPEETVYKYARTGRMPASKVGRYWRFDRSKIDDWVDQHSNQEQKPLRVLIVDDDPAVRSLLTKWVIELGCAVTSASGGDDAIRCVEESPCDMVLLDLLMPPPNGVETLRSIKRLQPDLDVVIVTAFFDTAMMDEALELGPMTILKKPVDRGALSAVLVGAAARAK